MTRIAFRDRFDERAARHESGGQHHRTEQYADHADRAAGVEHRRIHELHERTDACRDCRNNNNQAALDAKLVLNRAVGEHDDERRQRVD